MKRKITALITACFLLCGCSAGASVENLLTPPRLLDEQDEIYDELIKSVGQNVKLKYPRSGDYRSAFVLYNIDSEPGEEALVFYESKNSAAGEGSLRMKILDKIDNKWTAVYDLACEGSEVESVSFARLGQRGAADMIICYTLMNQSEKSFSVIRYADKTPVTLYSSAYSALDVYDLNGDGKDELIAVISDKVSNSSTAAMFTNGENGFEKLAETQLYSGAADYIRVTEGNLDQNTRAVFLDYSKGGGVSGTDVLYCVGSRLFCPDSSGSNPQNSIISRLVNDYMGEIYCNDVDRDGLTEIPATSPLPGYEALPRSEQLCAVAWYTIKDGDYDAKYYSYYSGKYRFALLFPGRWQGVVSAVPDFSRDEIIFISYSGKKGLVVDETTELMRIRTVDKENAEALKAANAELVLLGESDDACYFCGEAKGYIARRMALTESELSNSFIIL